MFLVVVALLFGGVAFGLLGALIAVPVAAALQVAVENLYIKDVVESEPESALSDLEEVMRRAPDFPGAANDYAWTLATNPKDAVRNGRKAA